MGFIKQIKDRRAMYKAIKIMAELLKDTNANYDKIGYYGIEDIMTNDFGEKMFIFDHRLIKPKGLKADGTITKATEVRSNTRVSSEPLTSQRASKKGTPRA